MINKITMSNVASYKKTTYLETDFYFDSDNFLG